MLAEICDHELREAYQRSGLWRRGWTYERAKSEPVVRAGLIADVRAMHKKLQKNGTPAPMQQNLLLGA